MKVIINKDFRYVGQTNDNLYAFERKGFEEGEETILLSRGKFVRQDLDLVFIFGREIGDIEPTYATESKLDSLFRSYKAEFGSALSREEFISKLIKEG